MIQDGITGLKKVKWDNRKKKVGGGVENITSDFMVWRDIFEKMIIKLKLQ